MSRNFNLKIPVKWNERMIINMPAIFSIIAFLFIKNEPIKEAEKPRKIKIVENPRTKSKEWRKMENDNFFSFLNSSIEVPVIYERYAGIRGNIQGDIKEKRPPIKAAIREGDFTLSG